MTLLISVAAAVGGDGIIFPPVRGSNKVLSILWTDRRSRMGRLLHFDSEQHRAGCCALCHDRGDPAVAAFCGQGTVSGHHISDFRPLSAGTRRGGVLDRLLYRDK